ncbi:MAG: RnfABCDGE type electron transport complex subunit D [Proteobacteria bacterium]|nr:RnfABCDGE type electron transport complex subunit D [Pseudomonadota bacterium]
MLKISTAPHLQAATGTRRIMQDVVIALMPAALAAVLFFGINALLVIATSVAACVFFEYAVCRWWFKTGSTTYDFSAVITGLLLAFNLPSSMPVGMIIIGAFMAIVVAKLCYGGLGKNIFNPALIGRVFLFISFPVQMTQWPKPAFLKFLDVDIQTAATTLGIIKHMDAQTSASVLSGKLPSYWDMFVGYTGGCIGEISALALLLGLAYMLWRRVITWHIPFYYISTVFMITGIMWLITKEARYDPLTHILSGGLMLGAIFMATDYTTSPMTVKGQVLFAVLCGILTVIIRLYSAYPEGVSFAILIMNAFVPLIDKYVHGRIYGQRS